MPNYKNRYYTEITETNGETRRSVQSVDGKNSKRMEPTRLIADTELNTYRTKQYMVLQLDGEGPEIKFQPGDVISGL